MPFFFFFLNSFQVNNLTEINDSAAWCGPVCSQLIPQVNNLEQTWVRYSLTPAYVTCRGNKPLKTDRKKEGSFEKCSRLHSLKLNRKMLWFYRTTNKITGLIKKFKFGILFTKYVMKCGFSPSYDLIQSFWWSALGRLP